MKRSSEIIDWNYLTVTEHGVALATEEGKTMVILSSISH